MPTCSITGRRGFTLIELLVVITVIAILAGLVLATAGYIQKKSARSRAEVEMAALSAALESYKVEYGAYPASASGGTDGARILYQALSFSNENLNPSGKLFFEPKSTMLDGTNSRATTCFVDPFGSAYNYVFPGDANRSGTNFFDLWSAAGANPPGDMDQWIKNW